MSSELTQWILALDDEQVFVAARALITFLDMTLQDEPESFRPGNAETTELGKLVQGAGGMPAGLQSALELPDVRPEVVASVARGLLLVALEMGYQTEVDQACAPVLLAALDKGRFTGARIVAALAVVLDWVPLSRRRLMRELADALAHEMKLADSAGERDLHRIGPQALLLLKRWQEGWVLASGGANHPNDN